MKSALLVLLCGLAGCSTISPTPDWSSIPGPTPIDEPKSRGGNKSSYVVWGQRYHVMDDATGYVQEGIASWYGEPFHGRKTSNGEVYDMHQMTAAHKNLPLPSYVLVTNKDNGKRAIVRVNDRGPFHGDRIIDLSYRAAQVLDMDKKGVADVKIEVITPGKAVANTSKEQQSSTDRLGLDRRWLNVQLLTTRNRAEAEKEKARLESELTHPVYIDSRPLSRDVHLRVGPVKGIDNAELLKRQMRSKGYQDAFIVK